MKIKVVPNSMVKTSRKSKSKYLSLIKAAKELTPGGNALKISYKDERELNALRNVIYLINSDENRGQKSKIKSRRDYDNNFIFFYIDKS